MKETDNEGKSHADFTLGLQKKAVMVLAMKRCCVTGY